jgi:hypothetical protein
LTTNNDSLYPRIYKLSDYELLSSSYICTPWTIEKKGRRKFGEIYNIKNGAELGFPETVRPSSLYHAIAKQVHTVEPRARTHTWQTKIPYKGVIASSKAVECDKCGQKTHARCLKTHTANHLKHFIFTCEKCMCKSQGDEEARNRTHSQRPRDYLQKQVHVPHSGTQHLMTSTTNNSITTVFSDNSKQIIGICETWLYSTIND